MQFLKQNKALIGIIIGVVICTLMFVLPVPDGFTQEGWRVLGILIPIVIIWATNAMPVGVAAVLFLVVLCLAGLVKPGVAFSGFANHLTWLMMGAFAISVAMVSSGLSKRIAYFLLSKAKGLWSIVAVAYFANLCMVPVPSSTARGGALAPILDSIMESLGRPTKSKFAKFLVYNFVYATTGWTGFMFMTGGAGNGTVLAFYESITGSTVTFIQWLGIMVLPALFYTVCVIAISKLMCGKLEPELVEKVKNVESLKTAYKELGPWTMAEKKVLVAFILAVVLWLAGDFIGLKAGFAAVIVCSLLFVPGLGCLDGKALGKVNWAIVLLIGSVMGMGSVITETGLADSLTNVVFNPIMSPFYNHLGLVGVCLAVTIVSLVAHFLLPSPNNLVVAAPVLLAWAAGVGLTPEVTLAFIVMLMLINDKLVFLAYQMPPYFVYLGMDVVDHGQFNSMLMKMYVPLSICTIPTAFIIYGMVSLIGV